MSEIMRKTIKDKWMYGMTGKNNKNCLCDGQRTVDDMTFLSSNSTVTYCCGLSSFFSVHSRLTQTFTQSSTFPHSVQFRSLVIAFILITDCQQLAKSHFLQSVTRTISSWFRPLCHTSAVAHSSTKRFDLPYQPPVIRLMRRNRSCNFPAASIKTLFTETTIVTMAGRLCKNSAVDDLETSCRQRVVTTSYPVRK